VSTIATARIATDVTIVTRSAVDRLKVTPPEARADTTIAGQMTVSRSSKTKYPATQHRIRMTTKMVAIRISIGSASSRA